MKFGSGWQTSKKKCNTGNRTRPVAFMQSRTDCLSWEISPSLYWDKLDALLELLCLVEALWAWLPLSFYSRDTNPAKKMLECTSRFWKRFKTQTCHPSVYFTAWRHQYSFGSSPLDNSAEGNVMQCFSTVYIFMTYARLCMLLSLLSCAQRQQVWQSIQDVLGEYGEQFLWKPVSVSRHQESTQIGIKSHEKFYWYNYYDRHNEIRRWAWPTGIVQVHNDIFSFFEGMK